MFESLMNRGLGPVAVLCCTNGVLFVESFNSKGDERLGDGRDAVKSTLGDTGLMSWGLTAGDTLLFDLLDKDGTSIVFECCAT